MQDHSCLQFTEEESAKLGKNKAVIKICPVTTNAVRLVTYFEITDASVETTIVKLKFVIQGHE